MFCFGFVPVFFTHVFFIIVLDIQMLVLFKLRSVTSEITLRSIFAVVIELT